MGVVLWFNKFCLFIYFFARFVKLANDFLLFCSSNINLNKKLFCESFGRLKLLIYIVEGEKPRILCALWKGGAEGEVRPGRHVG